MKKFILLPFLCFIFIQCTIKKSAEITSIKSIIENKNLNVIYRGIENRLTIYVPNTDSINVRGSGFSNEDKSKVSVLQLSKKGENLYAIIPERGNKIELTITGYVKGKGLIEKREFRILNIANPHTSINGQIIEMEMTKKNLAQSKIEMLIPQLIFELPKIKTFQYKINNEEFQFVNGNTFDLSARERIQKLQKVDSILIGDVDTGINLQNIDLKKIIRLKIHIN